MLSRYRNTEKKINEGMSRVSDTDPPNRRRSSRVIQNDESGERSSSLRSGSGNPVGLRILIHRCHRESNIVDKFMFLNQTSPALLLNFLRACHLCKKQLSPNKDVYMYRGDQGFCSVECRCRQMLMDEMEEFRDDNYRRVQCRRRGSNDRPIRESNRQRIPAMA